MQIRFDPEALAELTGAMDWYSVRSERAARMFVIEFERAVLRLRESPLRWPTYRHGTRKARLRRFPFAIVYRVGRTTSRSSPSHTCIVAPATGETGHLAEADSLAQRELRPASTIATRQHLATVPHPMPDPLLPLRFVLLMFAGLVNREQAKVVEYLREENRVLREQLGKRRLRLTGAQRARLASKAKALGRSVLAAVATIVTPDTLLRWHRLLIAEKHTHRRNRVGRPGLMKSLRELIVRLAKENPGWGYTRLGGELRKLDHAVARTTIAKTLRDHGVPPSPERPTSWRTFLQAHAGTIAAMDFFTAEVWTARGLVTHYVLFALRHASRMVEIVGVTRNPDAAFVAQVARNLTDRVDGFLRHAKFLILDRDTKFTEQFRRILGDAGIQVVTTAFQAPNMNAFAERFVQSIKRECLDRLVLLGPDHLRRALREFVTHYHLERPHQGLGNRLVTPCAGPTGSGDVVADDRLGGLLRSYRRVA